MDSSDDIESLPLDNNEQFVASDLASLQKVVKKKQSAVSTTPSPSDSPSESNLVRDLKIILMATVLFLIVGHPKLSELLDKFKLDTVTLYTVKASAFALILFILINRVC
jgi:hypothetical protein